LRSIVPRDVLVELEDPGGGVLHHPALCQVADVLSLSVVVADQAAVDLAPDAVEERDAIGVRVWILHRLRHANRENLLVASLGCWLLGGRLLTSRSVGLGRRRWRGGLAGDEEQSQDDDEVEGFQPPVHEVGPPYSLRCAI